MSTNLEYKERERRRQASEAKREKGRQRYRARQKKETFFFVSSGGDKTRAANNQIQGENERR